MSNERRPLVLSRAAYVALVACALLAAGCGDEDPETTSDTGVTDASGSTDAASTPDAGTDAAPDASAATDTGTTPDATPDATTSTDTGSTPDATTATDTGATPDATTSTDTGTGATPTWDEVDEIFFSNCATCHYSQHAGLAFSDTWNNIVNVPSTQATGMMRVAPGDPDNSYLWRKLSGTHLDVGEGERMPKDGALSDADLETIRAWIAGGAPN